MAEQQQAASERGTDGGKGRNGHDQEGANYEQELARYLQERIKPNLNSGAIPLLARSIAKEIARRERPDAASEGGDAPESKADAEDKPTAGGDAPESEGDAEDAPSAEGDAPEAEADAEDAPSAEGDESKSESDEDDEASGEGDESDADDGPSAEGDESEADADDGPSGEGAAPDFEADMHDLQTELGKDWILRFSVQGDDGWLTAEKADGSQRVEAQTAAVIVEAVELLNERADR